MKGVLVLAHGSRAKETEDTLKQVVEMAREKLPGQIIEAAYMEFGHPNVEKGLDTLAKEGCRDIVVVPYFLFDGIHIREDIPNEIDVFVQKNPHIRVTLGKTLGADPRLAQVLVDRIGESL